MTNLAKIVRSQQEFLGEKKSEKRQEHCAAMFATVAPVLPYLGRTSIKGEGAKTVTRLTNARRPFLIKGDTYYQCASPFKARL
jgi:hypothetical protein